MSPVWKLPRILFGRPFRRPAVAPVDEVVPGPSVDVPSQPPSPDDSSLAHISFDGRTFPPRLMMFPPYSQDLESYISPDDPVRFAAVLIALHSLEADDVPGSCAELGVYRGDMSIVIHAACPNRSLYLFDTFEGFPPKDLSGTDNRFKDTSVELVLQRLGDLTNVIVRQGYFPDTAQGLENEQFAFVMLDADLYTPTMAGLQFFYPRLVAGGYLFAHDYNSPESNWGVSRAVNEFLAGRPERPVAIPDKWGSVIIRKI